MVRERAGIWRGKRGVSRQGLGWGDAKMVGKRGKASAWGRIDFLATEISEGTEVGLTARLTGG